MSGPPGGDESLVVPDDQRRITLAYRHCCPRCQAGPGGMRMDPDGRVWYQLHPERLALVTQESRSDGPQVAG